MDLPLTFILSNSLMTKLNQITYKFALANLPIQFIFSIIYNFCSSSFCNEITSQFKLKKNYSLDKNLHHFQNKSCFEIF